MCKEERGALPPGGAMAQRLGWCITGPLLTMV